MPPTSCNHVEATGPCPVNKFAGKGWLVALSRLQKVEPERIDHVIRAAQIAFDGVKEEATLGARTTLNVLDADQELQLARAELYRSLRDEYVAGYTLLSAVDSLTVSHLGLDVARYDPEAYPTEVERVPNGWYQDESVKWSNRYRP